VKSETRLLVPRYVDQLFQFFDMHLLVQCSHILLQLTMNEDFSFVRFLKVVKTLYETSTFTQLGRTVGSALNPSGIVRAGISNSEPENDTILANKKKTNKGAAVPQDSLLDTITEACKPGENSLTCDNMQALTAYADELSKRDGAPKPSLLEQMMNCTLMANPEDEDFTDDEDTYKTRTEEETEGGTQSFETLSDEEEYQKRRKRRGKV
jgi:hypothetical protein